MGAILPDSGSGSRATFALNPPPMGRDFLVRALHVRDQHDIVLLQHYGRVFTFERCTTAFGNPASCAAGSYRHAVLS